MKLTLITTFFCSSICLNLSANANISMDEKTLIIVKSNPYDQQIKAKLSASNPELPFSDDRCGDSQIESDLKRDNNLALMDIEGSYHTLNCNYCRNGLYYDVKSKDSSQLFFTIQPPNGLFGGSKAVADCMGKIEIIEQILSSGNSAKITLKECGDRCPTFFEPNKTILAGYMVSISQGDPISDDLKFVFLKNKIDKYSKEYPQIYDSFGYQISDSEKAADAKTTLDLIQQYRNKILRNASMCKDNCKKALSSIKNYQDWYTGQNEQGRKKSDFLANLSKSLGLPNFWSYDVPIAYFSTLEPISFNTDQTSYRAPVARSQAVEMASLHELSKSTGIMEACKKVIGDSEHIIDNITSNLKSYLQNDTPSAEYIKNINLSLESQPKDIVVLNDMVKDIGDIKLKNIFFGLISNRYKFKTPQIPTTGDHLMDTLISEEQVDLKNKLIKIFGTQRINKAISTALNEYISLASSEKTSHLFSYSDDLKKDVKDTFNSEIKRMNMACKAVNNLHSDMLTGKKNPDLEEIISAVNESYKSKLTPFAVAYNPNDKSWKTLNDSNVNGSKDDKEEKREKIKKYLGDKRYYELYRQAYDKNNSSGKMRLPTQDELGNIPAYGETGFDLLLQQELKNRLSSISSKNRNNGQYRLATEEEWEITSLLNDNKDKGPAMSFNEKMIGNEVTARLKKVMEETVRQSSYNIANTKFIHLLLVSDFRKGLKMEGSGDVIQERCFEGDGKLFNEASVSAVKKAIAQYDNMTFDAMNDLASDIKTIKSSDMIRTASIASTSDESKKVDFIKESIKSSPLLITDLLRKKHDVRYEELLCIYINEINSRAQLIQTGTKVLFWTGVTVSTVATIMSSGALSFTVPVALLGVMGQVALATDILFIASQGYEAWQLYSLKKDVRMNNSSYYNAVQNTLMAIDEINDQKKEAIKSMFTMAIIAAVAPGIKIIKSQIGDGFKFVAKENGVIIKEKIIPTHFDETTGMSTEGKIRVKKTNNKISTETTTVTIKKSVEDITEKAPNAVSYDRVTKWENSVNGTTVRTKTKRIITKEVKPINTVAEKPGITNTPTTKVIRDNETVPTIVSETIATEIRPLDGINVEIIKTMDIEEKTVFNSNEILQTNIKKLNKKREILALYKKGELELKPATVEKLERDIKTLEDKIDGLIGRNESQRTVVKEKDINEDGSTTTKHTVTSKTSAARYRFQGPSEEHVQTSTDRVRNTLGKLGIKGEKIEPLVQSLGRQTAYFSNFLEETRMCMAMNRDNGFSAYASSTMWRLASSKFTAGAGTSLYAYWGANGNFGKNTADIDGDMVGQAVKAYGGAGWSTIHLIGKRPTSTTSLFLKSDTYEIYRQKIKSSLVDQPGVFNRFIKTWPKATLWSAGSKVVSGSVYYLGNDLLGNGAMDEYGDDALKASLVRLGYGVAWAVPSTALEVTLYNFIIGATCMIPGAKIFLNVSDGVIRSVNFTTATGVQFLYPLMTNWVYYNLRNVTYDKFNLHKINKTAGFNETVPDMDTYNLNVENIKSQVMSLDEYSDAIANGKVDRNKSYLVEISGYGGSQ